MTQTVQYASHGCWMNMPGHGCATEAEMHEYAADYPRGNVRVADDSTEGEWAPGREADLQALKDKVAASSPEVKARMRFAIGEVIKALRGE